MKLVFATHNLNKLKEVKEMVPEGIEILSLSDINCTEEIEETGTTLEENARIKVTYVKDHYGYDCFSDDSGLEIDSLNGAPGVYSARYAGEDKNNDNNIKKVWKNLKDKENKSGQFRTIIAADIKGKKSLFEGIIRGTLIDEKRGEGGFGYDPIFVPTGHSKTFAELEKKVKNTISHRAKAFIFFIKDLNSAI